METSSYTVSIPYQTLQPPISQPVLDPPLYIFEQTFSRSIFDMSRASKVTLALSAAFTVGTIAVVHYHQQAERAVRHLLSFSFFRYFCHTH